MSFDLDQKKWRLLIGKRKVKLMSRITAVRQKSVHSTEGRVYRLD